MKLAGAQGEQWGRGGFGQRPAGPAQAQPRSKKARLSDVGPAALWGHWPCCLRGVLVSVASDVRLAVTDLPARHKSNAEVIKCQV